MRIADIRGFEGIYAVTDAGHVISLFRHWMDTDGRHQMRRTKLLRGKLNDGYREVRLWVHDGRRRAVLVHRLVAEHFCSPFDGENVNHKDGDRLNNHWTNLEWCSALANNLHGVMRKRRENLTATEIDEILALHGTLPLQAIADRYRVCLSSVYRIVKRGR